MSENWYYVLSGERQGPVALEVIIGLYNDGKLGSEDYVWCKGFANWTKIKDVEEFNTEEQVAAPEATPTPSAPVEEQEEAPTV